MRRLAGTCATEAAQAFYELYLAMLHGVSEGKAAGDRNIRAVFDYASDHVCKNCMLCTQCWQRDYVSTLAALNDVTQPMLQRGRAEMSDFPYHFAARCARLPELMRASTVHCLRCASAKAFGGSRRKTRAACQAICGHYGYSSAAWRGGHAG